MPDNDKVVRHGRHLMEQHEYEADAAITAGDLVEQTPTGVQAHATDGVVPPRLLVAKDARSRGMQLGDAYNAGELAKVLEAAGGGLHLRLDAGAVVSEGDDLVSAGNGAVRAFDGAGGDTTNDVVAVAQEDLDNSGGTTPTPIATEVAQ